jgi:hypothetical protein
MPTKPVRPGSSARVSSKIYYRAKKTTSKVRKGQLVSAKYAKRYPHLVNKEKWLYLHTLRSGLDKKTKKETTWWAITEKAKLIETEKILPVTSFDDRRIRMTLANHRVFQKLWENNRGEMRFTISGWSEGRRIKEVIHAGFLKKSWEDQHNGKERFKEHIVGLILSNLRRRGLRLSNPKESAQRLHDLAGKRQTYLNMSELETSREKIGGWMERVRWATDSIRQQKRLKQLTRATIRIEKMV